MRSLAAFALAALLLGGCPEGAGEAVAPEDCERIGQRCQLPSGPIGVCNDTGRSDCDSPPCLGCMSQH